MKRYYSRLPIGGLIFCCLLASCSTKTLISNRKTSTYTQCHRQEIPAGSDYQRLLLISRLDNNSQEGERLREVTVRIIGALGRYYQRQGKSEQFNRYKWEINLLRNDAPAILALPGGKIAAYTGLFRIAGTDDQLAYLIGRNVAHLIACHHPRHSRFSAKSPALSARQALRVEYVEWIGSNRARFRNSDEKEADYIGLFLTVAAGYDPEKAIKIGSLSLQHRQELAAILPEIATSAGSYRSDESSHSGLVRSIEQAGNDTLSIQEKWENTLQSESVPAIGAILLVHVKSVSSFSARFEQFISLKSLGKFYMEEIMIDGASFQRMLLGGFSNEADAKKTLAEVQKQGFKDAFLVDYENGKRGKRRY